MTGPDRYLLRALAGVLVAALLAGCGLPLERGVREPGPVPADQVAPGAIQVLPPGPRPGAGPREIVEGFLGAQSNPDDGHAIARQFLAPELRDTWNDRGAVVVYDPVTLRIEPVGSDEMLVAVRAHTVARIAADGSYLLDDGRLEETYSLSPNEAGELRLVDVPPGLRLTPADASRSFRAGNVYFHNGLGTGADDVRLVPDRVFLPVTAEPVDALVRRLLAGPSDVLRGAVTTAVPPGTELLQPVTARGGVVTVDLSGVVRVLPQEHRQRLSAQLVWTLRGAGPVFSSLRLLVEGELLEVDGVGDLQDRTAWPGYDPDGLPPGTHAVFVQDRRLRRLAAALPPSEATDGTVPVDAAVLSPDDAELALLTRTTSGDELRVGPLTGPFGEPVLTRPNLASPSWGSGAAGLFVVETGPDPRVLLVRSGSGDVTPVQYSRPPDAGPLTVLQVSRDGARVAAVFGSGDDGMLWVGRIEHGPSGPAILGLRSIAPSLVDVSDVAWESGTSLVVLGRYGTANRLPVRVAVDGSEVEPVRALGLDGEPQSLTAAPGRPLVVATVLRDRAVLLVEESGLFRLQNGGGAAPAYPG